MTGNALVTSPINPAIRFMPVGKNASTFPKYKATDGLAVVAVNCYHGEGLYVLESEVDGEPVLHRIQPCSDKNKLLLSYGDTAYSSHNVSVSYVNERVIGFVVAEINMIYAGPLLDKVPAQAV